MYVEYWMPRSYTMTRRAEAQAETRRRIVEAAVDLHSTVGPARTSISMVAERAGVQRHTLYAHFPDERSLFMACSGLAMERDPLPDPAPLDSIADPGERLRTGLGALYAWYARNAQRVGCILRDRDEMPVLQEIDALRVAPVMAATHRAMGAGLPSGSQALLTVAMSFPTCQTLMTQAQMAPESAANLMAQAVLCTGK